jgi:hypothetical protein
MKTLTSHSPTWPAAWACALLLLAGAPAQAQHAHAHAPAPASASAPAQPHHQYAGQQQRPIKALSEQQLADLREGKGMSMALPAELNGYPGPLHTLQLADSLRLTPEQASRTQSLYAQMQQEAQAAGASVIAAETALDRLFRDKRAQPETLSTAVAHAAHAQAVLRETHLRYHLRMMDVLSPEQVSAYNQLRGY